MTALTTREPSREELAARIAELEPLATRYLWLRDQPRKSRNGRPFDAPFVMNPRQSVLYAIAEHRGQELDTAIDEDRLDDMCNFIAFNKRVEGDDRFADPAFQLSDEFANECEDEARAALGMAPRSTEVEA